MTGRFARLFAVMDEPHGMAWPTDPQEWTVAHRDAYAALHRPGEVGPLPPVSSFTVREASVRGEVVPGIDGFDFYSGRLREIVEAALDPDDRVQWFPFALHDEVRGDTTDWWVVHPVEVMPMDVGASTFGGLTGVIKGAIDADRVGARQLFKYPYGFPPVMSAQLRAAIEAAGCDGISWSPVPARRHTPQ